MGRRTPAGLSWGEGRLRARRVAAFQRGAHTSEAGESVLMHHIDEVGGGGLGSGQGWQPARCRVSLGCWHCGATAFRIPHSWQ